MDIKTAVLYCLEDTIGYMPQLKDRLVKDLDLDSLSALSLIFCIEQHFNLTIDNKAQSKLLNIIKNKTVEDLIKGLKGL